jgi:hypothetical protein
MAERLTPPLPYPHLMAHPTRAMTLAYTPETEAINAAQGYRVVAVDTRQIALIFTPAMRVTIMHS